MINSIFKLTVFTFVLFLVSSCFKKKIEPETLNGKWEFSEYEFLINSKDGQTNSVTTREIISESGFIEFTNNIQDQFKFVNGTMNLPCIFEDPLSIYYNNGKPVMITSDFYIESGGYYVDAHNTKDMYTGVLKNNLGNLIFEMSIKQISKNKITIRIGNVDNSNSNETASKIIFIELKKA